MINKEINIDAVRNTFQKKGYIKIDNFLDDEYAKKIFETINEIKWDLCYLSENGPVSIKDKSLMTYTPQQYGELNQKIMARAQQGFSYFYFRSDLVNAVNSRLKAFYEDLCGEEFLSFCRSITEEPSIKKVNGQLACYSPGCFLRKHTDKTDKEKRVAAYVINFTPKWNNDWGGLLHLLDNEQNILDILEPHFNSISIFKVPTLHYVSQVANYARGKRYTATGWMLKPD